MRHDESFFSFFFFLFLIETDPRMTNERRRSGEQVIPSSNTVRDKNVYCCKLSSLFWYRVSRRQCVFRGKLIRLEGQIRRGRTGERKKKIAFGSANIRLMSNPLHGHTCSGLLINVPRELSSPLRSGAPRRRLIQKLEVSFFFCKKKKNNAVVSAVAQDVVHRSRRGQMD